MPRVLHLVHWLKPGGIERWLLNMIAEFAKSYPECPLDIMCKGSEVGELADAARAQGAQVLHVPLTWSHAGFIRHLRSVVKTGRYAVVHNHLQSYAGVAVLACAATGVPIITSFHNTQFAPQLVKSKPARAIRSVYSRANVAAACRWSDHVTGCSRAVLDALPMRGSAPRSELPYGIDLPVIAGEPYRTSLRLSLGLDAESQLLIHVGRFLEQKDHKTLVRAFKRVALSTPNAHLVLIGDGPLRPVIQELVRREGLLGAVHFLGVRHDVPQLLAGADVFVFPSRFEGFGIAALEAAGVGLPVVATNVPGLAEAVDDGRTGILVSAGDDAALADAVKALLQNPTERAKLGASGRSRVIAKHSVHASARQLRDLYDAYIRHR